MRTIYRARLGSLMARERARFTAEHPKSLALWERAKASLLSGVPMNWMTKWAGGFPVFVAEASGARDRRTGCARHHADAPDRRRDLGRRGARAAVRASRVAVRAYRDRREPLR